MKILHCCLSCFYIEDYNYQENVLPRQNKIDGHEVLILASTETFINNNSLGYISPSRYVNKDGIEVIRIPYRTNMPHFLMRKIRAYEETASYISEFNPDVILFHGSAAYEIINFAEYKKRHPNVKLFVDSHEDFHNSARNFVSKVFLHRLLYKGFIHKALPYIEKVLCISMECYDFMKDFYKIPSEKLEIFPLGGTVIEDDQYAIKRKSKRDELKLSSSDILLVHSGKMSKAKRTPEILKAFGKVPSDKLRLVLLGSIPEEMKTEIFPLVEKDYRVEFLGWKSSVELYEYLCAADMYLQPGSQSATMQNAICCGCTVMLYPHISHELYLQGNGYYVKSIEDMKQVFQEIANDSSVIKTMSENSEKIARKLLDYKKLAARLYE